MPVTPWTSLLAPGLIGSLALAFGGCGGDPAPAALPPVVDLSNQVVAAEEVIHPETLAHWVQTLREGPAVTVLGEELHRLGLEPAGLDGSWQRDVAVVREVARVEGGWQFARQGRALTLEPGRDIEAVLIGERRMAAVDGAELLFIGHRVPLDEGDDALAGRVLLVYPSAAVGELLAAAAARGAAGVLFLPEPGVEDGPPARQPLEAALVAERSPALVASLAPPAARRLLRDLAATGLVYLPQVERRPGFRNLPFGITVRVVVERGQARDRMSHLAALLRGRDPGPPSGPEVVFVAAPLPAEGTTGGLGPDQAAAVAQVLGVARAFQALTAPPRRSVVFAFVAGEAGSPLGVESLVGPGGWSSRHVAGALTFEEGNLWGPTSDVTLVGVEASPLRSLAREVAGERERRAIPDPFPQAPTFPGSLAHAFVRRGVPAVQVTPGIDFPGRSVEWGRQTLAAWRERPPAERPWPGTIDLRGMAADARVAFALAFQMAEREELPPRAEEEEVLAVLAAAQARRLAGIDDEEEPLVARGGAPSAPRGAAVEPSRQASAPSAGGPPAPGLGERPQLPAALPAFVPPSEVVDEPGEEVEMPPPADREPEREPEPSPPPAGPPPPAEETPEAEAPRPPPEQETEEAQPPSDPDPDNDRDA